MKKLFIGILLILSSVLSAQTVTTNVWYSTVAEEAPTYFYRYQDVLDAMTTDPTGDTLTWQEDLIYGLDTCGAADTLDFFYVFATTNNGDGEALINWLNPGTFDADNPTATAWTKRQGYTGNATDDYISTNYNPYSDGINWEQHDASIGVFTLATNSGSEWEIGGEGSNGYGSQILQYYGGGVMYGCLNRSSGAQTSHTNSIGLYHAVRREGNIVYNYKNGSLLGSDSYTTYGVTNGELYVLAYNDNGSATGFSDNTIAIAFGGGSMSDTQIASVYALINTYLTNIGAIE